MRLTNFGGNVSFEPERIITPTSEDEILACLEDSRSRGKRVRAIGSLHSWSDIAANDEVILNLKELKSVGDPIEGNDGTHAVIGAGCTIERALDELLKKGYTLPTYGMFRGLTIAGAVSTATHGSGMSSLSHYVASVRVAAYDKDSGKARIYEWERGDELLAARCGLGCMGILLSVRVRVERDYLIEELTQWYDGIAPIVEQEREYPRQQFYLVPWSWRWFAQHRRPRDPESGAVPSANARWERLVRSLLVDYGLNGVIKALAVMGWWKALAWFYQRWFPRLVKSGRHVVDRAPHVLMMRHDRYRHVEMELFVPAACAVDAARFLEWVLRTCAGESLRAPEIAGSIQPSLMEDLRTLKGQYVHHHVITVRKVLRDEALLSMSSDIEAWYAISLITYQRDISSFLLMARCVARVMAEAYGARPHWGKTCPLDARDISGLYPQLPAFQECRARVDPKRIFVNDFAWRHLGL